MDGDVVWFAWLIALSHPRLPFDSKKVSQDQAFQLSNVDTAIMTVDLKKGRCLAPLASVIEGCGLEACGKIC